MVGRLGYKRVWKNNSYAGALREADKTVYFIPDTSSAEYLLNDFNLDIGDTLLQPFGGAVCVGDTAIVWRVDSVLVADGYHRQLWFNSFAYWIEGIGSAFYFLHPCNDYCISGNVMLSCSSVDGEVVFPANSASCGVSVGDRLEEESLLSVFPNPFRKSFQL